MGRHKLLFILTLLAATIILLQQTSPTEAGTCSIHITGGPLALEIGEDVSFDPVILDGEDVISTAVMSTICAHDARGTGLGWNVNISATDFVNTTDPSKIIEASGLSIPFPPTITAVAGNTSPSSYSGVLADGGFKLMSSPTNTGMGKYQINPILNLFIPASTHTGNYESTITITISSLP